MTVAKRMNSGTRFSARLTALALGTALIALPGAALAQRDDHRRDGNGGGDRGAYGGGNAAPRQEQARPAPPPPSPQAAPRPAPAPPERAGNPRGGEQWDPQPRAARGNPAGNGWQGRPPQPGIAPQQARPPFQGQPAFQGQPRGDGGGGGGGGDRHDRGQAHGDGAGHNDGRHNDGGQWHHDGAGDRRDGDHWRHDDGVRDRGRWSYGWRQDNRYDWRGWRQENRDTFHVGRYYPPYRNYSYGRLGIGFYLQPLFFGSDYWIADPWDYRLPPAYGPYHWVRYYNDAILVNTYTGQVADVIYDFFW